MTKRWCAAMIEQSFHCLTPIHRIFDCTLPVVFRAIYAARLPFSYNGPYCSWLSFTRHCESRTLAAVAPGRIGEIEPVLKKLNAVHPPNTDRATACSLWIRTKRFDRFGELLPWNDGVVYYRRHWELIRDYFICQYPQFLHAATKTRLELRKN